MSTGGGAGGDVRPDRVTIRSGARPHTEFGHDDVDADAELVVIVDTFAAHQVGSVDDFGAATQDLFWITSA